MSDVKPNQDATPTSLPSFSPILVVISGFILFFVAPYTGKTLVLLLSFILVAVLIWHAFSRRQYEKMRQTYPQMKRGFWITNNLVYHLAIPAAFFLVVYVVILSMR